MFLLASECNPTFFFLSPDKSQCSWPLFSDWGERISQKDLRGWAGGFRAPCIEREDRKMSTCVSSQSGCAVCWVELNTTWFIYPKLYKAKSHSSTLPLQKPRPWTCLIKSGHSESGALSGWCLYEKPLAWLLLPYSCTAPCSALRRRSALKCYRLKASPSGSTLID